MQQLYSWKVLDKRGNTISVVAPSKTQARRQYDAMFRNTLGRVISIERGSPVEAPMPRNFNLFEKPKKQLPLLVEKKQAPNDLCACKSGKKYKKCCGRFA
jgi:uncharacterized protein YchJ